MSCTNKTNGDMLCGGNYKYWSFKYYPDSRHTTYYYFDKNNKWVWYEGDGHGKLTKVTTYDQLFYDKWELINDSVLMLGGGWKYKINDINDSVLSLSLDTIRRVLRAATENDILSDTIYKHPDIPASFRSRKYKNVLDYVLQNMDKSKKKITQSVFDVYIETDKYGDVVFINYHKKGKFTDSEVGLMFLLREMPKWRPAMYKGKRVRSIRRMIINIGPNK